MEKFMKIEDLWKHIKINKDYIEKNGIILTFSDINWGDLYYNETGEECSFEIFGDEYKVGYVYITEDSDDWGQAESYQCHFCRKGDYNFNPYDLFQILENFKSEIRNKKIEEII